jgi:hypothetical protein
VVVALDLERDRLTVTEIDDARVLAGALQDPFAAARQPSQQQRRMLVSAVLGPEQREDAELELVRGAAEQVDDALELRVGEPESPVKRLLDDLRQRVESSLEARRPPRR